MNNILATAREAPKNVDLHLHISELKPVSHRKQTHIYIYFWRSSNQTLQVKANKCPMVQVPVRSTPPNAIRKPREKKKLSNAHLETMTRLIRPGSPCPRHVRGIDWRCIMKPQFPKRRQGERCGRFRGPNRKPGRPGAKADPDTAGVTLPREPSPRVPGCLSDP